MAFDLNKFIKEFRRASARNGLFISTAVLKRLPYGIVRAMANGLITIGYFLTIRQKRITRESLAIAFGKEKKAKEINRIAKSCFYNLGRGVIELIYFMEHPAMISQNITFEGKDILERAFAQGRGVIIVSAHFGNFPLMLLRCAQEGYKANAIIRSARDQHIEKYFYKKRSNLGLNTIYNQPRQECVNQCLKALRNNELLFIPLDQHFGSAGGVLVDFFGQKAATATGPVVFARRTKAPLIPMFIIRTGEDTHKIIVEPPLELIEDVNEKEMLVKNTAVITKLIEKYVRAYPHEWGWMHRRWKSQSEEVKVN